MSKSVSRNSKRPPTKAVHSPGKGVFYAGTYATEPTGVDRDSVIVYPDDKRLVESRERVRNDRRRRIGRRTPETRTCYTMYYTRAYKTRAFL